MDLTLTRINLSEKGIFSSLNGPTLSLFTLEHPYSSGNGWFPKVPDGVYACIRGTHKLEHSAPFVTYEVTGVPDHTGILFHVGNYPVDSEGCILLGQGKTDVMLLKSREAFHDFMAAQNYCDSFQLTVVTPQLGG